MKIFGNNIVLELSKVSDSAFEVHDIRNITLGKIIGIGESVNMNIEIGKEYYFHPQNQTLIKEESIVIIHSENLICAREEIE